MFQYSFDKYINIQACKLTSMNCKKITSFLIIIFITIKFNGVFYLCVLFCPENINNRDIAKVHSHAIAHIKIITYILITNILPHYYFVWMFIAKKNKHVSCSVIAQINDQLDMVVQYVGLYSNIDILHFFFDKDLKLESILFIVLMIDYNYKQID